MSTPPPSERSESSYDYEVAASAAACGPLTLAAYLNQCNDPRFLVLTEADITIPNPPSRVDDGLNSCEDACWLNESDDPRMTVMKSAVAAEKRVAKLMKFLMVNSPEHEFTKNTKRRVLNWNKQKPSEGSITPVREIPSIAD